MLPTGVAALVEVVFVPVWNDGQLTAHGSVRRIRQLPQGASQARIGRPLGDLCLPVSHPHLDVLLLALHVGLDSPGLRTIRDTGPLKNTVRDLLPPLSRLIRCVVPLGTCWLHPTLSRTTTALGNGALRGRSGALDSGNSPGVLTRRASWRGPCGLCCFPPSVLGPVERRENNFGFGSKLCFAGHAKLASLFAMCPGCLCCRYATTTDKRCVRERA